MTIRDRIGLYVHWPFCLAKCPYCDFNSHVRHQPIDEARFVAGLLSELRWMAERFGPRKIESIFFGGGTPSLMSPGAVGMILDAACGLFAMRGEIEITLEANPTSVEAGNFSGYRAAGVNRVSVGVQSIDDRALKALGRQHSAAEALGAFALAAKTFPRVSFDMIYTRPEQTVESWREELARALGEQQGHMSLYQLTIEPDTQFQKLHESGKLIIPGEDLALELYDLTQEMTEAAGLSAYEVSNHAAPGHASKHNTLYWKYGEYAGIGPGAHSRMCDASGVRHAIDTVKHPESWLQKVENAGVGINQDIVLSAKEQAEEFLMMGLRLTDGIDLARYEDLAGQPLPTERIEFLQKENLVTNKGSNTKLMATPKGRRVLNAVTGYLCNA
jgi:putative oxygen-independent coproporphyrinogen III oxidase